MQDLEFFRKEYKRQKKLEKIVNSRVLKRPKIKKWQVAVCFVALPFLLFFSIVLSLLINIRIEYKIIMLVFLIIMIAETYLRFCLIMFIKCYQGHAKEETRRRCKCIPSCSDYSIICLKKIFPLFFAFIKIKKRLFVTCDGEDYKVDFPIKKMGADFENTL